MKKKRMFNRRTFIAVLLLFCVFRSDALSLTSEELRGFFVDHFDLIDVIPELVFPALDRELLAKAAPDECFVGIGDPANMSAPPCVQGDPKVNQAYVWGLTKSGDDLWFGTAPNTLCLLLGGYFQSVQPVITPSFVCEYGQSPYGPVQDYLDDFPLIGDWRPPRIFRYNTENDRLDDMSGVVYQQAFGLISMTMGIRSAGASGDVVFLAGQALSGGVNMFAFDTAGSFLGAEHFPEYSIIRKWIVVNGVLYTAVGDETGGRVLRWTGSADDPFQFESVGGLDGSGAELAEHDGRLFVGTWPGNASASRAPRVAGLWMSPDIPQGGLTAAHEELWTKVWQAADYEADPVTALSYGTGGLASFGGYLYWGTMHVPFLSAMVHLEAYGVPEDESALVDAVLGTYRAIGIFRGRDFETANPRIDIVYGMEQMPVYIPSAAKGENTYTPGAWMLAPNKTGQRPLFGASGFGNPFNCYTWTMSVFDNRLYVGTMDWSFMASDILIETQDYIEAYLGKDIELPAEIADVDLSEYWGADLMRFSGAGTSAEPESLRGVGNYTNYGIRTMVADDALYLGTANAMNLMTDENDNLPEGGWELLRLSADADGDSSGGMCFISTLDP